MLANIFPCLSGYDIPHIGFSDTEASGDLGSADRVPQGPNLPYIIFGQDRRSIDSSMLRREKRFKVIGIYASSVVANVVYVEPWRDFPLATDVGDAVRLHDFAPDTALSVAIRHHGALPVPTSRHFINEVFRILRTALVTANELRMFTFSPAQSDVIVLNNLGSFATTALAKTVADGIFRVRHLMASLTGFEDATRPGMFPHRRVFSSLNYTKAGAH